MLPQITGLAMSLGTMIGGNLVAEMVFSYPDLEQRCSQQLPARIIRCFLPVR